MLIDNVSKRFSVRKIRKKFALVTNQKKKKIWKDQNASKKALIGNLVSQKWAHYEKGPISMTGRG